MPGGDYRDALRERAGWRPRPGRSLDADGERVGEHRGRGRPTRSASGRASAWRSASRATSRASTRCRTRSSSAGARTSRRTTFELERASFVAGGRRRRVRRSGPTSGSATARRRSRRRSGRDDRRAGTGGRWIVETDDAGLGRGARPGRGAVRRRRRPRRRPDRAPVRDRVGDRRVAAATRALSAGVSLEPALDPRASSSGIFHAVAVRAHPRHGRRPAAVLVIAAILGAWAGDALGGPARPRPADDRRLPLLGRVDRGVGRDRRRRRSSRSSARGAARAMSDDATDGPRRPRVPARADDRRPRRGGHRRLADLDPLAPDAPRVGRARPSRPRPRPRISRLDGDLEGRRVRRRRPGDVEQRQPRRSARRSRPWRSRCPAAPFGA